MRQHCINITWKVHLINIELLVEWNASQKKGCVAEKKKGLQPPDAPFQFFHTTSRLHLAPRAANRVFTISSCDTLSIMRLFARITIEIRKVDCGIWRGNKPVSFVVEKVRCAQHASVRPRQSNRDVIWFRDRNSVLDTRKRLQSLLRYLSSLLVPRMGSVCLGGTADREPLRDSSHGNRDDLVAYQFEILTSMRPKFDARTDLKPNDRICQPFSYKLPWLIAIG